METDETSRVKIEKLELGEGETVQWENSSGNEGKREMEGRKNRTDVEIEKEFWARIPGICGEKGGVTVYYHRVSSVERGKRVECLKLKLGCIGVKIEKRKFSRK